MAVNTLTEIYAQDVIDTAIVDESIRKSAVWDSGLVSIDPELSAMVAMGGGRKINRIGWNDLADPLLTGNAAQATTHNPGYPDDSGTDLIPNSNSTYMYDAVKTITAHSMGERDIIKACSYVEDPLSALKDRVSAYWARYFDMYATSILSGVLADNIASDSGDMLYGDGTEAIDEYSILNGFATLGDAAEVGTGVIICHSKVAFALRKLQLIDDIPSATNPAVTFAYFQGVRVLVSDNVPVMSGTCVSILAQPGVIDFGSSANNIVPSELYRDPLIGVGGGESQLITRQQFAMHPAGCSWEDDTVTGSVASGSIPGLDTTTKLWPCPADMALAANWERKLARKKLKIAYIWTSETGTGIA